MTGHVLTEIEIPDCYQGRVDRFHGWRLAIADMTGVRLTYAVADMAVSLKSLGPSPAPTHLPFIVAADRSGRFEGLLTPERRLGHWPTPPDEPLLILLALTVPSGVIHHALAGAIADRLAEMSELMHAADDGRWGLFDVGGLTDSIGAGLRRIAAAGRDAVVQGGYEPGGWWEFQG